MLVVSHLTKKFGKKVIAVDDLSFNIDVGEVCILLGPNGAGKSTTIKSIAGLLQFEGGITIDGLASESMEAKRIFSYVPETPALYELLTIDEHIDFVARAYGISNYEDYKEELLERFDLTLKRKKVGRELSKGMQQKVSLCCAAITNPRFIMFDEPMIGLDPKAIKELKKLFVELKSRGCAMLISTHIIDSVEGYWDKVLIMNNSKLVREISKEELISQNIELEALYFHSTKAGE
ncbi:MAG: ABC transporter ATP-binding protein [Vallitaleaceae bacterium]|jgi:ABC-2 type transport system ATP-binding protein|nr:ABC transporter ATP-binding protein [Vallitaleaceae bacterium]